MAGCEDLFARVVGEEDKGETCKNIFAAEFARVNSAGRIIHPEFSAAVRRRNRQIFN